MAPKRARLCLKVIAYNFCAYNARSNDSAQDMRRIKVSTHLGMKWGIFGGKNGHEVGYFLAVSIRRDNAKT